MEARKIKQYMLSALFVLFLLIFYQLYVSLCSSSSCNYTVMRYVYGHDGKKYAYSTDTPLIFVGGMPRSGTTLLRVLLDAHPDIRCKEETRVIPEILRMKQLLKSPSESLRLQEAGITEDVLDKAIAVFILEIIVHHGEPAPRLCNKDPLILQQAVYLHSLFPKAKFILLIRDGRAVVHSIITRKVSIGGFILGNYSQCLSRWNGIMSEMYSQCMQLGPDVCFPIHYEQLVLQPEPWMVAILNFLEVTWSDSVLHHEDLVDKPGGISISKMELSSDQVIKPINLEALNKWVGHIPSDVVRDIDSIAPMLATLGYDPHDNSPNYGKPNAFVLNNTNLIKQNQKFWAAKEEEIRREKGMLARRDLRFETSAGGTKEQAKEDGK